MTVRISIILLLLPSLFADGRTDARRGNEAYVENDFESATEAYQRGLASVMDDPDSELAFGLMNNLGASQYRLENMEDALKAFEAASAQATRPADRTLASYNAGNAAFKANDLQRALAHYRNALLADPANDQARFNYEFVKRQLQERGGGEQNQQNQEQQDQNQEGEGNEGQQDPSEQEQQDQEGNQQQDPQSQDEQNSQDDQQEGQQDPDEQGEPEQEDGTAGSPPDASPELSREQAEQILQALEADEAELLREVQKMDARPRRVEKDW